jgi:hypothetical protein
MNCQGQTAAATHRPRYLVRTDERCPARRVGGEGEGECGLSQRGEAGEYEGEEEHGGGVSGCIGAGMGAERGEGDTVDGGRWSWVVE